MSTIYQTVFHLTLLIFDVVLHFISTTSTFLVAKGTLELAGHCHWVSVTLLSSLDVSAYQNDKHCNLLHYSKFRPYYGLFIKSCQNIVTLRLRDPPLNRLRDAGKVLSVDFLGEEGE